MGEGKVNMNVKGKKRIKKIIILSGILIILSAALYVWTYTNSIINMISTDTEFNSTEVAPAVPDHIKETVVQEGNEIEDFTNIALLGIDRLEEDDPGRSDSILILTIDKAHNKLKLSSIMRDSYVNIDGSGGDKINHAYSRGGAKLAVKTINQNFNLNIQDYIAVDFFGMAQIVDVLGGITVEIKPEQITPPDVVGINFHIKEMSDARKLEYTPLVKPGLQNLNGLQAVAYARDRHSSANGDFDRTERQREVLMKISERLKEADVFRFQRLIDSVIPYVATSLKNGEIIKIGSFLLKSGFNNIEQQRFPLDNYCEGKIINDVWYLTFDRNATADQIGKYIFHDIQPK
jgi:polyisoprenyl-teichoic acid--peptidoglycan teichoic acid transferase